MSLTISLLSALSGLQTNQTALQVVSSNIANVNTPEYSRKTHQQETRVLAGVSSGVQTSEIIRKIDEFLREDLINETSVIGQAETKSKFYDRMQALFGSVGGNNSLGNAIIDLAVALEDVATSPEIDAHRLTAVNEASNVAREIAQMADAVQNLRLETDRQIGDAVSNINAKLESVARLNVQIARNRAQGIPTGDLQDQRDAAVAFIADYMAVTQFKKSDGQIILLSKEGRSLVSGGTPAVLSYTQSGTMTALQSYPTNISGILLNGGDDITSELTVGRLPALIEMRDQTLPGLTNQLDQLAGSLRDTLNRIQNRGANTPFGNGTAGTDDPALYGTRFIADPTTTVTLDSDVTFQILDSTGLPATVPMTIAAGATDTNTIVAAIDTYLDSGIDFGDAVLVNNRLEIKLEPGYRLAILDSGTTANLGDAQISYDADGDTVDETYFGFSNFFGLNDLLQSPELGSSLPVTINQGLSTGISSTLIVRADILDNPEYLARGKLRGTAPDYRLGQGDNEIAIQMADAFNVNLVFPATANGPALTTTTLAGYAQTMLAFNSAGAKEANDALEFQTFFFENLENRARAESGVNLDEELATMVVLQNAFQAAARVVQTTNEMFDELVRLA